MKTEFIKFRCSAEDKASIETRAKITNKTLSEYCREQALHGKIKQRPALSHTELCYFREVQILNTNFARLSNLVKYQDPALYQEIWDHLRTSKALLHNFIVCAYDRKG